jgi:hydroxymethylglutaryl-CoA lyase
MSEERMRNWPQVQLRDETMREGMQIESADIPVETKVELLNLLGESGLRTIVVGSFVSPRYTPQMAHIDEVLQAFTPQPGVRYTALTMNPKGRERLAGYAGLLEDAKDGQRPFLSYNMCDTFMRRNANRTQRDMVSSWDRVLKKAATDGVTRGGVAIGSAWGSNFSGPVTMADRMSAIEAMSTRWESTGVEVEAIQFADPMSWCMPHVVEEQLTAIVDRWPNVTDFTLHLHNARGMALPSIYAALRALDDRHVLQLDVTVGGIGGCPYCGNGRATSMAATEDVVVMLEEMGIDTGIDLSKLVEVAWRIEAAIGRPSFGHVSKAGGLPRGDKLYDPNLPFIETLDQAKHFALGSSVYEDAIYPWREPIPPADVSAGGASSRIAAIFDAVRQGE